MSFHLDARLGQDTLPVGRLELCDIRLLNDARWPWLVLVPQRSDCSEIFDLSNDEQLQLARETALISKMLQKNSSADKINTGALGNIVRQLHVHVIARFEGDANWPGPVWGFGTAERYSEAAARLLISQLQSEIKPHVF